jgi:hypothetical protein
VTRLEGVHVGVVGCALNVLVAVIGSLRPTEREPRSTADVQSLHPIS